MRWLLQGLHARERALGGPQDLITACLIIAYTILAVVSLLVGEVTTGAVLILAAGVAIRAAAISAIGPQFSNSVHPLPSSLVARGIYRYHRNPLLLSLWLELMAFALTLPVSLGTQLVIVVLCGLLCAWHAHEDNNRLFETSADYRAYAAKTGNFFLALLFPERPVLIRHPRFTFDTYAGYAFVGLTLGQIVALGYGMPLQLFIIALPAAILGAAVYWRLTAWPPRGHIGFSFFGGLLTAVLLATVYLHFVGRLTAAFFAIGAIAVATAHAVMRIGCLAHGCCTGAPVPAYQPYYVVYRDPLQKINVLRGSTLSYCAPTIVFEVAAQFLILLACSFWPAYALVIWCFGYGATRTIVQSVRTDAGHSLQTAMCVLLLITGCLAVTCIPAADELTWSFPDLASCMTAVVLATWLSAALGLQIRRNGAPLPASDEEGYRGETR